MEIKEKNRSGLAGIFALCPGAHIAALASAAVIALHLLLRGNAPLMRALSEHAVRPAHRALSLLWSHVRFSGAELLIGLLCVSVVVYIIYQLVQLIRCNNRLRRVYITLITLLAAGLFIYAGFCLLWGVYYYGDDFMTKSGLTQAEISVDELETVTRYFADKLDEYGGQVQRDDSGLYTADRTAILDRSSEVFHNIELEFPCLAGPDIDAKGIRFSRVMSYLDFTGFFFPFTAEANINTDFPPALFASTVAHELSHQRGVAKEQEANFTAVLACLSYGDADYSYSACMLAYTHLGNALYSADYDAWQDIYLGLSDEVRADMRANSLYWRQFDTPVQAVSNTVYESFLQSYDQTMGLRSYGACVDLLVSYYLPTAENAAQP